VQGVVDDEALREVLDRLIRGADADEPTASKPKKPPERVARASSKAALVPS